MNTSNDDENPKNDPALLFLREKDFLSSLRAAVAIEEEQYGTIKTHFASSPNDKSTQVEEIILPRDIPPSEDCGHAGSLRFADGSTSSPSEPYHFIIATDGMHSTLRSKYAGYQNYVKKWKQNEEMVSEHAEEWEREVMEQKNAIEDRMYVVFRGNAPLTDKEANMDGTSFQTWGEGKSMRFAAVGMSHPVDHDHNNDHDHDGADDSEEERCEKQVWFATICDEELCSIKDAEERKKKLVQSFQNWHDPICRLIQATPANEILMERGVCHKHSLLPVLNLADVMNYKAHWESKKMEGGEAYHPYANGPGPILLFAGDAYMAVDPVLAQGFTMGMESAADLAKTLEMCMSQDNDSTKMASGAKLPFNSRALRDALTERNERRYGRILCLLRSTELVQAMAQPTTDSFSSFVTQNIVRPVMKLTPSFVKEAAFEYVMKYSLGYFGNYAIARREVLKRSNQKMKTHGSK